MWEIIDNKTLKLELKKMRNQTNRIAHDGYSTKIYIVSNDMELEKQTKPKDSLIDIMNRRFDSMNKRIDEKFNLMFKELKKQTNKTNIKLDKTNKKLNSIDKRLSNIEKLPTIAKELSELK